MISIAMCNTAVGLSIDQQRLKQNSFAAELARQLYNRHKDLFIDCNLSGAKAWVYPMPGPPSWTNLLKLIFFGEDVLADAQFRSYAHKRYGLNFKIFDTYFNSGILMRDRRGEFKRYYAASTATSIDNIRQQDVSIECIEGVDWYAYLSERLISNRP